MFRGMLLLDVFGDEAAVEVEYLWVSDGECRPATCQPSGLRLEVCAQNFTHRLDDWR